MFINIFILFAIILYFYKTTRSQLLLYFIVGVPVYNKSKHNIVIVGATFIFERDF